MSSWGKARTRSMPRPMPKSTHLPMKPLMMPRTVPMMTLMIVAEIAMNIDRVTPATRRERTSRPVCGSTPNGWARLAPPKAPLGTEPRPLPRPVWKVRGGMRPRHQVVVEGVRVDDAQLVQYRRGQGHQQEEADHDEGCDRDLVAAQPGLC